jgi:dCTP diphosphatase
MTMTIRQLEKKLETFAVERDWNKYHSPKNLSMALAIEASELLEEFQWLTEEESRNLGADKLQRVRDEAGDVFICLLRLASKLKIDLMEAAEQKLAKNAIKYPVEKSRGNARKYTEFTDDEPDSRR